MWASFALGMLGSLVANMVTRPVEHIVSNNSTIPIESTFIGKNKSAIIFAGVVVIGSIIYLSKKK